MTSIGTMITRISGIQGTKDVSDCESKFIGSIVAMTQCGKQTSAQSDKQPENIQRIHDKHFA